MTTLHRTPPSIRPRRIQTLSRRSRTALPLAFALAFLHGPLFAQRMPREDVVDVLAVSEEGLCVSNLFQTNMVLQRDKPIHVWGWGTPGAAVTVRFAGAEATGTCNATREWRVALPPCQVSSEPRALSIESGDETLTLGNILVGDVWVLGGQSNMEFETAKVENGALEIASANYPGIRILTVPYGKGTGPRRSFPRLHEWSDWFGRHFRKGDWDECSPDVAKELSAIGLAFARRVHTASQIPIGIIDASRGGTTAEAWTPRASLKALGNPEMTAKYTEWEKRASDWNPAADLAARIERHRSQRAKLQAEGKPIPRKLEVEPSELSPGPIADPNYPGNCFAEMIGPLRGFQVKGALFHQGYNNAFDGMAGVRMYKAVFPEMIKSWRGAFSDPELPFGILSLCTDGYPQTRDDYLEKMLNAGIHIRAAQYRIFLDLWKAGDHNIGFASTYDLRRRWYHPQVKLPAGERLARWALATQYGFKRSLPWRPPELLGMETTGAALVLRLDTDVMDPEDGAIVGFSIAGEDRCFQPAEVTYVESGKDNRGRPRLDRKQLVLSSPLVSDPIHFRYAWGRNPMGNLQVSGNKDLPFATQRSDDWDMGTVPLGVLSETPKGKMTRAQRGKVLRALRAADIRRRIAEAKAELEALDQAPKAKR